MEFLVIVIIAIILVSYLIVAFIIIRRSLGLEPVSPEVRALIKEVKQIVQETNAKVDKTIKTIDNITLEYHLFKGATIGATQSNFICNDTYKKIVLPNYSLSIGISIRVFLSEPEFPEYFQRQEKAIEMQWNGSILAGVCV
ncbi:MAG: hypothetical protein AAB038_03465 [Planctomycetota bacterium]